jgi:ABC-type sugar transport system substrate-binding protein
MKKVSRTILVLIIACSIVLGFSGCQGQAVASPTTTTKASTSASESVQVSTATEKPVIGFDLYWRQDQWWKDLEAAALKTADEKGVTLNVQNGNADANTQITQLESFIAQGVKAIIYAPIDPDASAPTIKEATDKGIIVVCIEEKLNDMTNVACYVNLDQYKGGYDLGVLAGQFINSNYPDGKGKALILGMPENITNRARAKGFREGITATDPNVNIVDEQDTQADRAKSLAATETILTAHPDLAVVFGVNTEAGMGAVGAYKNANVNASKVAVYCEGWGKEFSDAMTAQQNYLKGVMCGPAVPYGTISVNAVADYLLKGTALNKDETFKMTIVTKDNLSQYTDYFQ